MGDVCDPPTCSDSDSDSEQCPDQKSGSDSDDCTPNPGCHDSSSSSEDESCDPCPQPVPSCSDDDSSSTTDCEPAESCGPQGRSSCRRPRRRAGGLPLSSHQGAVDVILTPPSTLFQFNAPVAGKYLILFSASYAGSSGGGNVTTTIQTLPAHGTPNETTRNAFVVASQYSTVATQAIYTLSANQLVTIQITTDFVANLNVSAATLNYVKL
jgi:hypothetical protein